MILNEKLGLLPKKKREVRRGEESDGALGRRVVFANDEIVKKSHVRTGKGCRLVVQYIRART